jgi:hypothetical protein
VNLVTIFEKTTGDSPEVIAYFLTQAVLAAEKRIGRATREEILDAYAECLAAVRGERLSLPKTKALPWPPQSPIHLDDLNDREPTSLSQPSLLTTPKLAQGDPRIQLRPR